MRVLRGLLGFVDIGRIRQELRAVTFRDVVPRVADRVIGYARGIGAHVGDEAHGAFRADLHAFVQPLRQPHGALHAEAQLARGFLLQRGCDEGGHRVALFLARAHGLDDVVGAFELLHDAVGGLFRADLRRLVVLLDEARGKQRRLLPGQVHIDGPVFLLQERADFALALHHQPQRHRLHAAGGKAAPDFVPQQRRDLVAHQPVEHAPRLLRIHQVDIHLPRHFEGFLHGLLGDLVEHHPVKARTVLPVRQFLLKVIADGLTLAVRVGRQVHLLHPPGGLFQIGDELLLPFDDLIPRLETVVDVHRQVSLREILDVAKRSFDYVLLTQILVDGFRLCRRLHDYQSLWHMRLSE